MRVLQNLNIVTDKAESANGVLLRAIAIPGEKERQTMTERLENGLPLAQEAWKDILNTARNAGISQSTIDHILN